MPTKKIRLGVEIGAHDFDVKVARARKLLASPACLRISVDYLEASQERLSVELLDRFLAAIEDMTSSRAPLHRGERGLVAIVWSS